MLNTWTRLIPKKVREQPRNAVLVNLFFRIILDKMTVIMIVAPLDICQTEPGVKLKAIYAKTEENKSKVAGIIGKYNGAYFFIKLDWSKKSNLVFLFLLTR